MPLVRISLMEGKSADYRRKIGDVVHQAMVDTINCPLQDRFQLISEHSKGSFLYAPVYLDIPHTDDLVMIQITLNEGRAIELKKSLYKAIAERLQKAVGLKPQDVFINLVEVKKENWSFGNGIAQYAP
jgi:phenylpyruvate tautomerase PptA (4-oxalocrotonate tautomerase family)